MEIQQRAMEYLRLSEVCSPTVLATVLEIMPPYPEKQSPLLVRLKQKKPLMEAEGNTESSPNQTEDTPKVAMNIAQPLPPPQQQQDGLLLSLDTNESYTTYNTTSSSYTIPSPTPPVPSSSKKLLFKNSDIIFENDLLQLGIKTELKKPMLHVEFYYGNKTNSTLSNISVTITPTGEFEPGKRNSLFNGRNVLPFNRTSFQYRTNQDIYRSKSSNQTNRNN